MSEITVNNVRDGVFTKLDQNFPDSIKIYGEKEQQGFTEPCFFVKLFPVSQEQELGNRYKRYHTFDIHYFPESKVDANEECHNIAEQLYSLMEYIAINSDQYQGTKMRHEIIDGVLHFFVSYDFRVKKEVVMDPFMQTITQKEGVK